MSSDPAHPPVSVPDDEGIVIQIALSPTEENETNLITSTNAGGLHAADVVVGGPYRYRGATGRETALPSGVIAMGDRLYVPAIGRFLQVDPLYGGSDDPAPPHMARRPTRSGVAWWPARSSTRRRSVRARTCARRWMKPVARFPEPVNPQVDHLVDWTKERVATIERGVERGTAVLGFEVGAAVATLLTRRRRSG